MMDIGENKGVKISSGPLPPPDTETGPEEVVD